MTFLNSVLHSTRQRPDQRVDPGRIRQVIEQALASAGLASGQGPMDEVSRTIRQALASAGLGPPGAVGQEDVIDVVAREVRTPRRDEAEPQAPADEPARPGQFVSRSHTNHAGTRGYKLFVPAGHAGDPAPLLVMLHGCTQSPDDFAAGTRMNDWAQRHGFLVAYPAQARQANKSGCWNWFLPQDQARDQGEPAVLAGITREVAAAHAVDQRRIYVAGLSSGAAMAVILGEAYPELYAAVGVHSGLPYAAAHDLPSAFAAMKGRGNGPRRARVTQAVPTIVFHGDRDTTVAPRNGAEVAAQAQAAAGGQEAALRARAERGTAAGGRAYTRTTYADGSDRVVLEQWEVHGAGHAWSGGSPGGTYTDPAGPDASAEMVRFFLSQQRGGSA